MIRASILLTFKDGRSFSYANRFLVEKTGNDGYTYNGEDRSTPLMAGVPGVCYYYTGLGTDTYEAQTGKGKAKTDYEDLQKQIGGTGNVKFYEADSSHGETDIIIRNLDETLNNDIANDKISFSAADLVSVKLSEEWITFPGDDLDRNSRDSLPKNSINYVPNVQEDIKSPDGQIIKEKGAFAESLYTPSRTVYEEPMNLYYKDGYKHIPNPILSIVGNNESVKVLNRNLYKEVYITRKENGWECYGEVTVKEPVLDNLGNKVIGKDGLPVYKDTDKVERTGTSFIQDKVIVKKVTQIFNYEGAPKDEKFEVMMGEKIIYREAPIRKNYTFNKWTIDQAGKKPAPTVADGEDITVYAQWKLSSNLSLEYDELSTFLPKMEKGKEYNLMINTLGVPASKFKGANLPENDSEFDKKLKSIPDGATVNLTMDLPYDVTDATYMIKTNSRVKSVNITRADNLKKASGMIFRCPSLENFNLPKSNIIENAEGMVYGCTNLKDAKTYLFKNCTDIKYLYSGCASLTEIDTSVFDGNKITRAEHLFEGTSITSADISMFKNLSETAVNNNCMFQNCTKLTSINWGDIQPKNVTDMFKGASAHKTIIVTTEEAKNFIVEKAANMQLENYTIKGPGDVEEVHNEPLPKTVKSVKTQKVQVEETDNTKEVKPTVQAFSLKPVEEDKPVVKTTSKRAKKITKK